MFERFTDRARRVVVLAQEEARLLNHNYIGTEHILLGLMGEGEGVAARALASLGIEPAAVRWNVLEIVGTGVGVAQAPSGHIPFTPRAKKVLEFSLREALQLGHNYIGTEHILLGLVREGEGVAAQVLTSLGADLETVRMRVAELLAPGEGEDAPPMPGVAPTQIAIGVGRGPSRGGPSQTCTVCGRDLWDVERYVRNASAFVCNTCVADAARALESSDDRAVVLPPRGFGSPPPPRDDLAEIQRAFTEGFGGDVSRIEDGERISVVSEQIARNYPGIATEFVVERVRMDGPDAAEVAFTLFVQSLGMVISETGRVRRVDGRWIVGRETSRGHGPRRRSPAGLAGRARRLLFSRAR